MMWAPTAAELVADPVQRNLADIVRHGRMLQYGSHLLRLRLTLLELLLHRLELLHRLLELRLHLLNELRIARVPLEVLEAPSLQQFAQHLIDVVRRHDARLREPRSHVEELHELLLSHLLLSGGNADRHEDVELPGNVIPVDRDRLVVEASDKLVVHELPVQRQRLHERPLDAGLGEQPGDQFEPLLARTHYC